jgi:hypothetical protein
MNLLHRLTRRLHEQPAQLRNAPEVLPIDWWWVGAMLRKGAGLPPVDIPAGYPPSELLAAWEDFLPGSAGQLLKMARDEANHREWLARNGYRRDRETWNLVRVRR